MRAPDPRYPDAAKRMHDIICLHQSVLPRDELLAGRIVAIRLSDGGSDGVAYHDRASAMRHQLHWSQCAYFRLQPEYWSVSTCDTMLQYVRWRYDAGWRPDPENPDQTLILPTRLEGLRQ